MRLLALIGIPKTGIHKFAATRFDETLFSNLLIVCHSEAGTMTLSFNFRDSWLLFWKFGLQTNTEVCGAGNSEETHRGVVGEASTKRSAGGFLRSKMRVK